MAVVGSSRIGRYACLSGEVASNLHYLETFPELSGYVLKMIELGVGDQLEFSNERLVDCLKLMERLGII